MYALVALQSYFSCIAKNNANLFCFSCADFALQSLNSVVLCCILDCCRWYWSIKIGDGDVAALPSLVGRAAESLICGHRRERKVLFSSKPAGWSEKLAKVNSKILSFVYDLKQSALATCHYLKRSTTMVDGQLQFLGKGRGHEILRIRFELAGDKTDPAGPGAYFLYSDSFEAKEICCVSSTADRSGFDLLKEHYAGLFIMNSPMNHSKPHELGVADCKDVAVINQVHLLYIRGNIYIYIYTCTWSCI